MAAKSARIESLADEPVRGDAPEHGDPGELDRRVRHRQGGHAEGDRERLVEQAAVERGEPGRIERPGLGGEREQVRAEIDVGEQGRVVQRWPVDERVEPGEDPAREAGLLRRPAAWPGTRAGRARSFPASPRAARPTAGRRTRRLVASSDGSKTSAAVKAVPVVAGRPWTMLSVIVSVSTAPPKRVRTGPRMQWSTRSWRIVPPSPAGAAGSASTKIRPGARGAPSAAVASGGEPGPAVPGSIVQAVMRTVSNEPRSTMSHPETVRPSRTSSCLAAPGEDPRRRLGWPAAGPGACSGRRARAARRSVLRSSRRRPASRRWDAESPIVTVPVVPAAVSAASRPVPPVTTVSVPTTAGGFPSRSRS